MTDSDELLPSSLPTSLPSSLPTSLPTSLPSSLPSSLPDELAAALRRATVGTLGAIHSLRAALREHVQQERTRGATLAEIDTELRMMIGIAGGDRRHSHYSAERVDDITCQVLKWSEVFYSRRP